MLHLNDFVMALAAAVLVELIKVLPRFFRRK